MGIPPPQGGTVSNDMNALNFNNSMATVPVYSWPGRVEMAFDRSMDCNTR